MKRFQTHSMRRTDAAGVIVRPGNSARILNNDVNRSGVVYEIIVRLNRSDAMIDLLLDQGSIIANILQLDELDLSQPRAFGWWMAKFDTTNDDYVAIFTANPGVPFSEKFSVVVKNPPNADTNLTISQGDFTFFGDEL